MKTQIKKTFPRNFKIYSHGFEGVWTIDELWSPRVHALRSVHDRGFRYQDSGQDVRISKKSRKSSSGTSKTSNYSRSKYIVNRTRLLEEIRLCAPRLAYCFKVNILPTISCNPDILREMMVMMVQVLSPKEHGDDTKTALEIEFGEKVESLMDGATVDRNNLAQKCCLFL